jgi:hypothetical protein
MGMRQLCTIEARGAQERVRERKKVGVILNGYHFCLSCERVTENIGDLFPRCCWCGGTRVHYIEKIDL